MSIDPRVAGYAEALFSVAKAEGALEQVGDELFGFARTLGTEARLRDALVDPSTPAEQRAALVGELLGARANPHTTSLISFVVAAGRARDLTHIIDEFVKLAAAEAGKAVADVRTAVPLDGAQRERLTSALHEATGKEITLKVTVDPAVIGGFVARVGDTVFDATVRRKLELAKEHFGRT